MCMKLAKFLLSEHADSEMGRWIHQAKTRPCFSLVLVQERGSGHKTRQWFFFPPEKPHFLDLNFHHCVLVASTLPQGYVHWLFRSSVSNTQSLTQYALTICTYVMYTSGDLRGVAGGGR